MLEQYSIAPRSGLLICCSDASMGNIDRLESVADVGQLAVLTQPGGDGR